MVISSLPHLWACINMSICQLENILGLREDAWNAFCSGLYRLYQGASMMPILVPAKQTTTANCIERPPSSCQHFAASLSDHACRKSDPMSPAHSRLRGPSRVQEAQVLP